jgi:hypothetical protein
VVKEVVRCWGWKGWLVVQTDRHARLRLVSSTALKISRVTASGCDTMDACEAVASSIRAFPRSAMNRCPAGGMAWSSVPTKYQEGMDRHPGGPEGVAAPAALRGRWVAAITAAVSGSTSGALSGVDWSGSWRFAPWPSASERPVDVAGVFLERHQDLAGRS